MCDTPSTAVSVSHLNVELHEGVRNHRNAQFAGQSVQVIHHGRCDAVNIVALSSSKWNWPARRRIAVLITFIGHGIRLNITSLSCALLRHIVDNFTQINESGCQPYPQPAQSVRRLRPYHAAAANTVMRVVFEISFHIFSSKP